MILPMSRVRIVGAGPELSSLLRLLLDFGRVHLDDTAPVLGLARVPASRREEREARQIRRILDDADAVVRSLSLAGEAIAPAPPSRSDFARWARAAHRARGESDRLRARTASLEDERTLLEKHHAFLQLFGPALGALSGNGHLSVYGITLPAAESSHLDRVADLLRTRLRAEVSLTAHSLPSGDLAVLIAVPSGVRGQMDSTLGGAGIPEIPLPPEYAGQTLGEAAPRMMRRLREIPDQLRELDADREALARRVGPEMLVVRALAHDRLSELEAARRSGMTEHAFVLEGWLPRGDVRDLRRLVRSRFDHRVIVEEVAREEWQSRAAPVVLTNPRLFRPFETITGMLPLPRYGTIDPTPFLAVTFPMLFGMILGDVGYGVVLASLAFVLRWRAPARSPWRAIAEIAFPCAAFGIIFGVLYGELFGDLGRTLFGFRPVLVDREEAVIAAALVAVGVGLAHVMLGLVLGIVSAMRGERRVAISRMVQLLMLVLVVLALLAALKVLPAALFTPFGLAALVGFPVLLAIEGIVAPIEFFSTLGNVLSYVRIMALGTASVMLAVLANKMLGLFGSAVVGVLFALLFHLVNFALGLVSPTIHALRLHYVEFFRQFYSGGGQRYEPFAHWRPTRGQAA